jgi:hypothetical protein
MKRHEPICWKNPNRHCSNCNDTGWQDEGDPCYWCSKVTPDSDAAELLGASFNGPEAVWAGLNRRTTRSITAGSAEARDA